MKAQVHVSLFVFVIINLANTIKPIAINQTNQNVSDTQKLQLKRKYEINKNNFRRTKDNPINESVHLFCTLFIEFDNYLYIIFILGLSSCSYDII